MAGSMIRIWDPFVRLSHWLVALAMVVVYLTEDDVMALHAWAGYLIGALVILRILWGFVGPRHARFTDFVYRPAAVLAYLRDMLASRARRYLGHSPAGGAMAVALLAISLAAVGTGIAALGADEGKDLLPAWSVTDSDEDEDDDEGGEAWEELHEALANLTLLLIAVHILGVLFASLVHRENLTRAMFTGDKRATDE